MTDHGFLIRKLQETKKPQETKKKEGISPSNGGFDIHRSLLIGPQEKPSITELAKPAFDRAKAMEKIGNADHGNTHPEHLQARKDQAEIIAQTEFNNQLAEWALKYQHLDSNTVQTTIKDFRTQTVEYTANGENVTKEQQFIRDTSKQLLNRFNEDKQRREQEAHYASMTAEKAYEQSGQHGNSFE